MLSAKLLGEEEKKESIENFAGYDYHVTTDGTLLHFNNELTLQLELYKKGIIFLNKPIDTQSLKYAAEKVTRNTFSFGQEVFRVDHRKTIEAEIPGSRWVIAAASELLEKLQDLANVEEPQSIELLQALTDSYNFFEANSSAFYQKKIKEISKEENSYAVYSDDDDGHYQAQDLYQTTLSLLTIINGYANEQEDAQIVYRHRPYFLEKTKSVEETKPAPKPFLSPLSSYVPTYLTRPVAFLPFITSHGILPTGFPDSMALRISPSCLLEGRRDFYQSRLFLRYFFTFKPFGASLVGKTTDGSTIPLLNFDVDVPPGQKIIDVEFQLPSFHEDLHFLLWKFIAQSMMKRLGSPSAQVICHLHGIEDFIHVLTLYFSDRMTFSALGKSIQIILERQLDLFTQLTSFFKNELHYEPIVLSPFDNLMGNIDAVDILGSIFKNLKLDQLTPAISRQHEDKIIELCLIALVTNTTFMDHQRIWNNLAKVVVSQKGRIRTLKQFFEMANVAAFALTLRDMPSYTVCYLRLCSESMEDMMTTLYFKEAAYNFKPYVRIDILDPCVTRENFQAQDKREEGTTFHFRAPVSASVLAGPLVFFQSLRNAAARTAPKSAEDILREQQEALKRGSLTPLRKSVSG